MATVETALARAKAHVRKGDVAQAKTLCRDVLARYPRNARARTLLARLPEAAPSQELLEKLVAAHKAGHSMLVAEQVARLLPIYPDSYVLWQIHGGVLLELGAFAQAEESLARAAALRPDLAEARVNHSVSLRATGRGVEAEAQVRAALDLDPDHAGAMMELASVLADRGDLPAAANLCQAVIAETPEVASAHNILGVAAYEEGRFAEAQASYEQAVDIAPGFAEAHRNLAAIKPWTAEDAQLDQLRTLYDDPAVSPMDRARICFGLFDAFDRLGQPDEAWPYLKEGNALRKALMAYDISQDIALFATLAEMDVAPLTRVDPAPVKPIFILGMPRSGTTLTEQIVSAHGQVTGAGELPLLADLARDFLEGAPVTEDRLLAVRRGYLAGLAAHAEGARHVTDKMPHNFCFLPLICAAFPEARIVHVVRDAPSVCWSNLKQYFTASSLGYCYDLDDVVAYHGLYRDWTARCEAAWPGRVRRLDYAALTADPEAETRALIADLGLDWDTACLSPQDNTRGVHTASAGQVRQPVYPAQTEAWVTYAPWVGTAFAGLRVDS
ncbi:tetratricopeptide repeat-containing sulfotransferase family protein [Antarctobacter heliothermus]|uniref:Tetratricopeptide repeat-containing protein n=1 Tax=Antarctobacter heliothermus TaxID=74033 RepID=A0A239LKH4_9RHOB|nr:sulfotransferase [Antarctobacter heliothermus]SNT30971.1 Tetratricopeptide repeat-containing protein [Antarctobacter heliothermus]